MHRLSILETMCPETIDDSSRQIRAKIIHQNKRRPYIHTYKLYLFTLASTTFQADFHDFHAMLSDIYNPVAITC